MISPLMRAEIKKISGNRMLMGCAFWLWPILAGVLVGFLTIAFALNESSRADYGNAPWEWNDVALQPWFALNNPIGRLILLSFAVTVFATEYQNNTWKTILPGRGRVEVLFTKYLVIILFVVTALTALMITAVTLVGLMHLIFGFDYPPAVTSDSLLNFLGDLLMHASLQVLTTLIIAAIAILIALYTRTLLFGLVAGLMISLLEFIGIPIVLLIIAVLTDVEWVVDGVAVIPTYNAENIISWATLNEPRQYFVDTEGMSHYTPSLLGSVFILGLWISGLIATTLYLFLHQDIQ